MADSVAEVLKEYERAVAEAKAKAKATQRLLQTENMEEETEGEVLRGKATDGSDVEVNTPLWA